MSDDTQHSLYSASKGATWINCPGSIVLAEGKLGTPANRAAAYGSVTHKMLQWRLQGGTDVGANWPSVHEQDGFSIAVDADMIDSVEVAVAYVESLRPHADFVLTEQVVNYSKAIGAKEEEAWGTADVLIGMGTTLIAADYKSGYSYVPADSEQLKLYGLGALASVDGLAVDYDEVMLVVIQPKGPGDAVREHRMSKADLLEWARKVAAEAVFDIIDAQELKSKADDNDTDAENHFIEEYLRPSDKACQWCAVNAVCPKLHALAQKAVTMQLTEATESEVLAEAMRSVDLVETWASAVRAETERRLLRGVAVGDFKLVRGRKGNAAWTNVEAAEAFLKVKVRLKADQLYDKTLISPTAARKLAKAGAIPAKKVADLEALITASEGKLSVAPGSDKRPAVTMQIDATEFDDISGALPADFV